jgi:hypothetical protein
MMFAAASRLSMRRSRFMPWRAKSIQQPDEITLLHRIVHVCASYRGLRYGRFSAYDPSCWTTPSEHTNLRLGSSSGCALTSSNGIPAAHRSHSAPCVLAPAASQMARSRADYSRCADVPYLHRGRCMCPAAVHLGSPFARWSARLVFSCGKQYRSPKLQAEAKQEITAMPGQYRWGANRLAEGLETAVANGLTSVLLFGVLGVRFRDRCASICSLAYHAVLGLLWPPRHE